MSQIHYIDVDAYFFIKMTMCKLTDHTLQTTISRLFEPSKIQYNIGLGIQI